MLENKRYREIILDKEFYFPNIPDIEAKYNHLVYTFGLTGKKYNPIKGSALEKFANCIFSYCPTFYCIENIHSSSNQIDLLVRIKPYHIKHPFLHDIISPHFIIECKKS